MQDYLLTGPKYYNNHLNISAQLLNKLPQFWFKMHKFDSLVIWRVDLMHEKSILAQFQHFLFFLSKMRGIRNGSETTKVKNF